MDTPHKPLWPKIMATVVVLAVLYVASFGPACWIATRIDAGEALIAWFYLPVLIQWNRSPPVVWYAINWYANLGSARLVVPWIDVDGNSDVVVIF